jgi:mannose-6-phosphate isomerase-like protein (cupin superfamily)
VDAVDLDVILQRLRSGSSPYREFIRKESLSVGLYVLPAGAVDRQKPHREDEVYYVTRGRGKVTVLNETHNVGPGMVVYVGSGVEHYFHEIEEELQLLVFFAPAEGHEG